MSKQSRWLSSVTSGLMSKPETMKTFVVYEVWTRHRVVSAETEEEAYTTSAPLPVEGMSLCNWHAVEVAVEPEATKGQTPS